MKLIGNTSSPFVRKVRIVAWEKRVEYEWIDADPWATDSAVPGFNPLGEIPVLVLDDGSSLFDSRVICEFLDHVSPISKLLPQGHRERMEVKRWEALADGILDAAVSARLEGRRAAGEQSPAWIERQMGKIASGLDAMEGALSGEGWCCGHAFTLADVAVAACTGYLDFRFPQIEWRKGRPNLEKLAGRLLERPSVADTLPE